MSVERKPVGDPEPYHGWRLQARFMGPDLLSYVDDLEMPNFYIDVASALAGGRRYVDAQLKEEAKRRGEV